MVGRGVYKPGGYVTGVGGYDGGDRIGYSVTFSVLTVLCEIIRYSLNHNGGSRLCVQLINATLYLTF